MFYDFHVPISSSDLDVQRIRSAIQSEFNRLETRDSSGVTIERITPQGVGKLPDFDVTVADLARAHVAFVDLRIGDDEEVWAAIGPSTRTAQSVFLALLVATALARSFRAKISDESDVLRQGGSVDVEYAATFLKNARGLSFSETSTLFPSIYPA